MRGKVCVERLSMITDSAVLEAIETICDQLSERTATLFLGAGINAGIKDDAGRSFPLGSGLANWISKDLLEDSDLSATLSDVSEMAQYRWGKDEVNRYLYDQFSRFEPGTAHLALVQLPWDVIYTTNYDLLVEEAANSLSETTRGPIRPVVTKETDLSTFTEDDILYYKLHGSIDLANSDEGRLILTREDYRHYELHRKPLFKRLERDLISRTFVFIGYSLQDLNFRNILEDCRNELDTNTLPLSFAVLHSFTDVQETFWRDKYNIQLLKSDSAAFLNTLRETWEHQNRSVVPFETRRSKEYIQVDEATRFPKIAESFYHIRVSDCTGPSNAQLFFHGAEPSWADIRDGIAPKREVYWPLLEAFFPELAEPDAPAGAYLVTGAAGTGKTTLIRTIAYELASECIVLAHIPGTPLDARFLSPLVSKEYPQRIVVLVRHAAEYIHTLSQFMEELRRESLPVTVLLEERKNQWNYASETVRNRLTLTEFELGPLAEEEINNILDALERYDALGKLTGASRSYQVDHFTSLATKELLVALRELTSESSFDEIVRDEFRKIPSEAAKRTYTYVAALGQLNLPVRYQILMSLVGLRADQLRTEIFTPTEGVLISGEESGRSRHSAGFNLRTRHPVIASIIFDLVAPDDNLKFVIINDLLTRLDTGYPEDRRVLAAIVRRKELVETLASQEKRRAVYERLEIILPNDPYVLEHRSILERRMDNPKLAIRYARRAITMSNNSPTALNTLGFALELEARHSGDTLRRQALLSQASTIFESLIQRDSRNPYGYVGKASILRQYIQNEGKLEQKKLLQASELSLLEEAYEMTDQHNIVASALATSRGRMGDAEDAIDIIKAGLENNPNDNRLRDLWVRYELDEDHFKEALEIAVEGAKLDPTSWRMQRHIARCKRALGDHLEAVKGHYEAAIRHNKGDVALLVELGAYLFMNRKYAEARSVFSQASDLAVNSQERRRTREWWKDSDGKRTVFSGKVKAIRGSTARTIAIPEGFEAFFWRTRSQLSNLREGDPVTFTVGFNAQGPTADILLRSA